MTEWYLKENPDKHGYVLCEPCYEKSKEFLVYVGLLFSPEKIDPTMTSNSDDQ